MSCKEFLHTQFHRVEYIPTETNPCRYEEQHQTQAVDMWGSRYCFKDCLLRAFVNALAKSLMTETKANGKSTVCLQRYHMLWPDVHSLAFSLVRCLSLVLSGYTTSKNNFVWKALIHRIKIGIFDEDDDDVKKCLLCRVYHAIQGWDKLPYSSLYKRDTNLIRFGKTNEDGTSLSWYR